MTNSKNQKRNQIQSSGSYLMNLLPHQAWPGLPVSESSLHVFGQSTRSEVTEIQESQGLKEKRRPREQKHTVYIEAFGKSPGRQPAACRRRFRSIVQYPTAGGRGPGAIPKPFFVQDWFFGKRMGGLEVRSRVGQV